MATVRHRGKAFHCAVKRRGFREYASFPTREAAEAWGRERDEAIKRMPPTALELGIASHPTLMAGVYLLFTADGGLVYIGQTGDLHRRLVRHRENGMDFARWGLVPCEDLAARRRIEAEYITRFNPPGNKLGGGNGASPRRIHAANHAPPIEPGPKSLFHVERPSSSGALSGASSGHHTPITEPRDESGATLRSPPEPG